MEKYKIPNLNFQYFFNEKYKDEEDKQKIISDYITNDNVRGLLLFHKVGTGKTRSAIKCCEKLKRKTLLITPKAVQNNFIQEYKIVNKISKEIPVKEVYDKYMKDRYKFITINAGNKFSQIENILVNESDELKHKMKNLSLEGKTIVIDEAHNLISMILQGSKDGNKILDLFMNTKDIKIILLSGTPIINDPFELSILGSILTGIHLLPIDYDEFYDYFVKDYTVLLKTDILTKRFISIVSYFDDKKNELLYPKIIEINEIPVEMSDLQYKNYKFYRKIEQDKERVSLHTTGLFTKGSFMKKQKKNASLFKIYTRLIANFTFPERLLGIRKEKLIELFVEDEHKLDFKNNLIEYSPKMKRILTEITKEKTGIELIYSNFVSLEGHFIFSKVLQTFGFVLYSGNKNENFKKEDDYKRFAFWTGDIKENQKVEILKNMTSNENFDGKLIRYILLSSSGSEGLNLKNIRKIHIMEPYWNMTRFEQVIGRGRRRNSHMMLDEKDRNIKVYIYYSVARNDQDLLKDLGEELTSDQHILKMAKKKQLLVNQSLEILKNASIDCVLDNSTDNCMLCAPTNLPAFYKDIKIDVLPENNNCNQLVKLDKKKLKFYKKFNDSEIFKSEKQYYIEPKEFKGWFMEIDINKI